MSIPPVSCFIFLPLLRSSSCRAEGVSSDTLQACDWFSDSNTPLLTVCIKLLKLRTKKDAFATKEQQQTRPMARAESAALRRDPAGLLVHFLRKRCSRMDNWIEEKRLEEKRPCQIIEGRSSSTYGLMS